MKKFWKKKETKETYARRNIISVDMDDLLMRFLLDLRLAESQQLGALLGIALDTPEEIAEEQAESDERLTRVSPMVPIMHFLSDALGKSFVEYFMTISSSDLMDDEADTMADLVTRMCLANAVGSLTQLEDLGLITYNFEVR